NAVKNLPLVVAIDQLAHIEQKASLVVLKVLRQAVANAENNHRLDPNTLKIRSIQVQNGPVYKRFQAVSRGRAHAIQKKTSHIMVELEAVSKQ
ncbi:50S ribosomal protein L22, partial [Candidatus Woesebacteria bacterium]|nr:50S ribosomal protein L22 [Candidatus Woesebacteria bacterium]